LGSGRISGNPKRKFKGKIGLKFQGKIGKLNKTNSKTLATFTRQDLQQKF
jgi:hypothetical protein